MAVLTNVSTPATGDDAIFEFKQLAVVAGWVVTASGNGVSAYGPTSDVITTPADLGTPGAWFRLKMPGAATREFLFIRLSATTSWNILYSVAGFFGSGNGTPSATVAPTASDQRTLINGTLLAVDGTYRWLLSFDNAAPYECWAGGLTIGTLAAVTAISLLAMATGSYDAADVDPYAAVATSTNVLNVTLALWQSATAGFKNFHAWYRYGLVGAAWRGCAFGAIVFGQSNIGPDLNLVSSGLAASVSGQEVPLDIVAGFGETPCYGIKGRVNGARYTLASQATVPNGTHLTDGNGLYWLRVTDLWLPWDVTVPAL